MDMYDLSPLLPRALLAQRNVPICSWKRHPPPILAQPDVQFSVAEATAAGAAATQLV